MSYPGAAPKVQAHLYKSICQPVLTYGMECISYSKDQFRRMEFTQGRLIKQCLGLPKSSHNTAMLKALNIDEVQNTVNRNVLNLYHRIFKIENQNQNQNRFIRSYYRPRRPLLRPYLVAVEEATWKKVYMNVCM